MKILNHKQITQKIKRLSIEILEQNYDAKEIVLAGINQNGWSFSKLLYADLSELTQIPISLTRIKVNSANPLAEPVALELNTKEVNGKTIIVVDDVANTGRTLFYAFQPLTHALPGKIQVAVLIDRTHKTFPIQVDFCGLSLATTLREHIQVNLTDTENFEAFLS